MDLPAYLSGSVKLSDTISWYCVALFAKMLSNIKIYRPLAIVFIKCYCIKTFALSHKKYLFYKIAFSVAIQFRQRLILQSDSFIVSIIRIKQIRRCNRLTISGCDMASDQILFSNHSIISFWLVSASIIYIICPPCLTQAWLQWIRHIRDMRHTQVRFARQCLSLFTSASQHFFSLLQRYGLFARQSDHRQHVNV